MKNLPEHLQKNIETARKAQPTKAAALTGYHSLDLTSLSSDDTVESINALVERASDKKIGHVAATCVYPRFLTQTFNATAGTNISRATVINFPTGKNTAKGTFQDSFSSIAKGANEIDIVLDYESFLKGNIDETKHLLLSCKKACEPDVKMKVILESAAFNSYEDLYDASVLALQCGADFLKTSTGKSPAGGASLEAVATMLQAIKDTQSACGIKVSGGVKTVKDCAEYISLAKSMMGDDWVSVDKFRIGASSLLSNIKTYLKLPDVKLDNRSPSQY